MPYVYHKERRIDRFMRSVGKLPSGCWQWTGYVTPQGYGLSALHGKKSLAHRVSYSLLVGDVPEGLDLDHICRNRSCVNPAHLEPVTRSENLKRGFDARGCNNGHPYTEENTSYVTRSNGVVERRCKICHRVRNKNAKLNRRLRKVG